MPTPASSHETTSAPVLSTLPEALKKSAPEVARAACAAKSPRTSIAETDRMRMFRPIRVLLFVDKWTRPVRQEVGGKMPPPFVSRGVPAPGMGLPRNEESGEDESRVPTSPEKPGGAPASSNPSLPSTPRAASGRTITLDESLSQGL